VKYIEGVEEYPAKVMAALEGAIDDFAGATTPFDDIAMMVIKCLA